MNAGTSLKLLTGQAVELLNLVQSLVPISPAGVADMCVRPDVDRTIETSSRNDDEVAVHLNPRKGRAAPRAKASRMSCIGNLERRYLIFPLHPGDLGGRCEQICSMRRSRTLSTSAAVTKKEAFKPTGDLKLDVPTKAAAAETLTHRSEPFCLGEFIESATATPYGRSEIGSIGARQRLSISRFSTRHRLHAYHLPALYMARARTWIAWRRIQSTS